MSKSPSPTKKAKGFKATKSSHTFAHLKNRFKNESDLRNILPDLKDVGKAWATTAHARQKATKGVSKYSGGQEAQIKSFLEVIVDSDAKLNEATEELTVKYREFYACWEDVLAERVHLKKLMRDHEKKTSELETHVKNRDKAKKKEDKITEGKEEAAVTVLEREVAELSVQVHDRMLAVQKDLHHLLRKGYYTLNEGRNQFFRKGAILTAEVLEKVHEFPAVASLLEDGSYTYAPHTEAAGPLVKPTWHLGDEFKKRFDKEMAQMGEQAAIEQQAVTEKVTHAEQMIKDCLEALDDMIAQSKIDDKGRQLEVNQALLAEARVMIEHAGKLVDGGVTMQDEVEKSAAGMSEKDKAARNSKWHKVMLNALNTIVDGTPLWLECTRQVIRPPFAKHEELQVASRDISASSAQLTAFVKNQGLASDGATGVVSSAERLTKSSHALLLRVREAQNLSLSRVALENIDGLSETQGKKLVMATQVEVLRLEAALEKENHKLMELRKRFHSEL